MKFINFKNPMVKTILIAIAFILLMAAAILIKLSSRHLPQRPTPTVTLSQVKTETWQDSLNSDGSLKALKGTILKTQGQGQVTQVLIKPGTEVKAGDALLTLDSGVETGNLEKAKAQAELDKITYDRDKKLLGTAAISKQTLDQALYTYQTSLGAEKSAQAQYDHMTVTAPFDGKVGVSDISIGDYLATGATVVSLQKLDPLYVDFTIPEKYISKIKVGEQVTIDSSAYPNKQFTGQVTAFDSQVNADTGMLKVRATFPNKDYLLLPGNFVNINLFFGQPQKVLAVPQTAINYSTNGDFVYGIKNNKAVKIPIKTNGQQIGQDIIVQSGLYNNEPIVSAGGDKIHDGSVINGVKV